ncbi:hypothetical protein ABBQ38_011909 [Trebouxia sp. C0009 RCD-2024]
MSATIIPLMGATEEELRNYEHAVKNYLTPPYTSVADCCDNLSESWEQHPFRETGGAGGSGSAMDVDPTNPADITTRAATALAAALSRPCPANMNLQEFIRDSLVDNCDAAVLKKALALHALLSSAPPASQPQSLVGSARPTTKSHTPSQFAGLATDQGKAASAWLYSLELYFAAEYDPNPVAKAVTYLCGAASDWWRETGSHLLPARATFAQFSEIFLARYVKPSDSQHARNDISHLTQADMSVEAFAAHFRSVKSRITVGSPIDTSTLAGYFLNGLKKHIVAALTVTVSLATMQDLDLLITAAEEMDAKLSLFAKQAPSANAVTPSPSGGDGYGPVRRGRGRGRGKPSHYNKRSPAPGAQTGPKSFCLLHGDGSHTSNECNELAKLATQRKLQQQSK